jgi:hypothetical protein
MKKYNFTFALFASALFAIVLTACGGEPQKTADDLLKKNKEEQKIAKGPAVSKEVLADIIKSIPSPIEISFFIKDLQIKYDKTISNSSENTQKYNTNYKQALNLGIYSTDLGYCNIYEQKQDALGYLGAVKEMTTGLKMDQFLDFNTIKKLATSGKNLDSLLLVTTANLEKINEHLQEKGRADLTILILTGGWLESLYLTCAIAKKHANEALFSRIGEQKIILDQLLLLLSFYESNSNIKALIEDMNKLQTIYNDVKITYKYKQASTKQQGDVIVLEQNTESEIIFTSKDLDNVFKTTKAIREKITE